MYILILTFCCSRARICVLCTDCYETWQTWTVSHRPILTTTSAGAAPGPKSCLSFHGAPKAGEVNMHIAWEPYTSPYPWSCSVGWCLAENSLKGPFIVTQLNSTRRRVELSCVAIDTLTGSRRAELIGDSCSRCERVDNSTSSWVVSL